MDQAMTPAKPQRPARRHLGVVVAVTIAVAAIDQLVKQLMLNWLEPGVAHPVIGDWFRFYLLFNSGAAFSMGRNLTGLFTAIQLTFVVGALWFGPRMARSAMCMPKAKDWSLTRSPRPPLRREVPNTARSCGFRNWTLLARLAG